MPTGTRGEIRGRPCHARITEQRPGAPGKFTVDCLHHKWQVRDLPKADAERMAEQHLLDNDASDPCWARAYITGGPGDPRFRAMCEFHRWEDDNAYVDKNDAQRAADEHNDARTRELHPERIAV